MVFWYTIIFILTKVNNNMFQIKYFKYRQIVHTRHPIWIEEGAKGGALLCETGSGLWPQRIVGPEVGASDCERSEACWFACLSGQLPGLVAKQP